MSIEETIKEAVRSEVEPLMAKVNTLEGYLLQLVKQQEPVKEDMVLEFKMDGKPFEAPVEVEVVEPVEMAEDPLPSFTDSADFLPAIKKLCADTDTEPADLKAKLVEMGFEKFSLVPKDQMVSVYTQLKAGL